MAPHDDIERRIKIVTVRDQVIELLKANGLTIDEVFDRGDLLKKRRRVKYRNPDNPSQVWCGRGRQPNWVRGNPE